MRGETIPAGQPPAAKVMPATGWTLTTEGPHPDRTRTDKTRTDITRAAKTGADGPRAEGTPADGTRADGPQAHRTDRADGTRAEERPAPGTPLLRYPPRSLVILTGLPGAGKTTLLRRLYGLTGAEGSPAVSGPAVVIDSAQSRLRWRGRLDRLPKPLRTAAVFATHVTRIARALAAGHAVVAHNRGCAPYVLRGFAWLARRHGAGFHLLLLDASPEAALAGQQARGRVVAPATFVRHRRRWEALLTRARAGDPSPAASAHVMTRADAARLTAIHFDATESR